MADKMFTMSSYASKEDLYEAKARYYQMKFEDLERVLLERVPMVEDVLHIICGNCGNSKDFNYVIEKPFLGKGGETVVITCTRCGTGYPLEDLMERENHDEEVC